MPAGGPAGATGPLFAGAAFVPPAPDLRDPAAGEDRRVPVDQAVVSAG